MTAQRNHTDGEVRPPCGPGDKEAVLEAQEAILSRRRISVRLRVVGVFILIFLFLTIITVEALVLLSEFRTKTDFIENMANYVFEIQQARRFEKNFFLYGSDLAEALANTRTARHYLERSVLAIQRIIGENRHKRMTETLTEYENLLETLVQPDGQEPVKTAVEQKQIEIKLRQSGAQIVTDAQDMIDSERQAMNNLMHTSRLMLLWFLVFMFVVMAVIALFIIRAVLTPLGRFVEYARRIGLGDYSPIRPVRWYRDEFSDLAMAFNQMLLELKTHQDQLMQSRKMAAVGTLTSGIAHELNNPLNNIGLITETLIESFNDYTDQEKLGMLNQIYDQQERSVSTVRNLLDFTRSERPVFTSVDLQKVLASTARLLKNEMQLSAVELHQDLETALPHIKGNPLNLQQVFLNLFLNAIQAMPNGGRIDVRARQQGNMILIEVSDTGCGISEEHLENIFDPFFTTKEPGQGTGLGLSVSYGIIEKHGGRITAESEPGKGCTFSVLLPVREDP